jgi:hypothetical protein
MKKQILEAILDKKNIEIQEKKVQLFGLQTL